MIEKTMPKLDVVFDSNGPYLKPGSKATTPRVDVDTLDLMTRTAKIVGVVPLGDIDDAVPEKHVRFAELAEAFTSRVMAMSEYIDTICAKHENYKATKPYEKHILNRQVRFSELLRASLISIDDDLVSKLQLELDTLIRDEDVIKAKMAEVCGESAPVAKSSLFSVERLLSAAEGVSEAAWQCLLQTREALSILYNVLSPYFANTARFLIIAGTLMGVNTCILLAAATAGYYLCKTATPGSWTWMACNVLSLLWKACSWLVETFRDLYERYGWWFVVLVVGAIFGGGLAAWGLYQLIGVSYAIKRDEFREAIASWLKRPPPGPDSGPQNENLSIPKLPMSLRRDDYNSFAARADVTPAPVIGGLDEWAKQNAFETQKLSEENAWKHRKELEEWLAAKHASERVRALERERRLLSDSDFEQINGVTRERAYQLADEITNGRLTPNQAVLVAQMEALQKESQAVLSEQDVPRLDAFPSRDPLGPEPAPPGFADPSKAIVSFRPAIDQSDINKPPIRESMLQFTSNEVRYITELGKNSPLALYTNIEKQPMSAIGSVTSMVKSTMSAAPPVLTKPDYMTESAFDFFRAQLFSVGMVLTVGLSVYAAGALSPAAIAAQAFFAGTEMIARNSIIELADRTMDLNKSDPYYPLYKLALTIPIGVAVGGGFSWLRAATAVGRTAVAMISRREVAEVSAEAGRFLQGFDPVRDRPAFEAAAARLGGYVQRPPPFVPPTPPTDTLTSSIVTETRDSTASVLASKLAAYFKSASETVAKATVGVGSDVSTQKALVVTLQKANDSITTGVTPEQLTSALEETKNALVVWVEKSQPQASDYVIGIGRVATKAIDAVSAALEALAPIIAM